MEWQLTVAVAVACIYMMPSCVETYTPAALFVARENDRSLPCGEEV